MAGVRERVDRLRVLDDAADVVQRHVRQARVLVAGEQRLAVLRDRLVHVHAVAVVADDRLRHEGDGLAVGVRDVVHRVLQHLHFVGLAHQRVGVDADFALAGGGDFVVVHFDLHAQLFERQAHGRAQVLERIDRRHREVAALHAGTVRLVAFLVVLARAPRRFDRIDLEERALHGRAVAHVVEDEEFVLRAEQRAVADAGGLEVGLARLASERGSRS